MREHREGLSQTLHDPAAVWTEEALATLIQRAAARLEALDALVRERFHRDGRWRYDLDDIRRPVSLARYRLVEAAAVGLPGLDLGKVNGLIADLKEAANQLRISETGVAQDAAAESAQAAKDLKDLAVEFQEAASALAYRERPSGRSAAVVFTELPRDGSGSNEALARGIEAREYGVGRRVVLDPAALFDHRYENVTLSEERYLVAMIDARGLALHQRPFHPNEPDALYIVDAIGPERLSVPVVAALLPR